MRNISNKVALATLTSRSVLGEYLHIPFHENGSAANMAGVRGTVLTEATLAENGDYATKAGYMTLTGTQSMQITGADIADFISLNTVENQMLVGMRFYPAAAPNGYLWAASPFANAGNGYGGYGAQYSNISSGKLKWQPAGNGTTSDLANLPTQVLSTASVMLFVIDVKNGLYTTYKDGVSGASAALTTPMPICQPDIGLSVACRGTTSAPANILQNTIGISDFWMLRTATDMSADVADIAKACYHYPVDLPAILRAR